MTRKDDVSWILMSLFLVFFLMSNFPGPISSETPNDPNLQLDATSLKSNARGAFTAETPHDPINIVGDNDFNATALAEGWPGNGAPQNPYIIEGLSIDLDEGTGHCIYIRNTRVHFIISDCFLTGASVQPGSGICFNNVSNGEVTNNTCTDNYSGIYLLYSDSNTLIDNTCNNNNGRGILLYNSDYNTISDNECNFNVYYGIYFSYSNSNIITNNLCNDTRCGVCFSQSDFNEITSNTCTNNICGIRCYADSLFCIIANNTSTDNHNGVRLDKASSFTVANNTLVNNVYGVVLNNSVSNTVRNNTCNDNNYGIYVHSSAATNDILWNTFEDNSLQNGHDDGSANLFDYNYWSDYSGDDMNLDGIGDTPYSIPGIGNYDQHPLMFPSAQPPISWVESPISWVIELGESFRYDLNATAYDGIDYWWLNDTAYFDIDQSGIVTNTTLLPPGVIALQVMVNDTSGYILSGVFTVTVEDGSPPIWSELPTDQITGYGELLNYDLNATDTSGLHTWWLNDTTRFAISENGLVTNASLLPVGTYGVHVWINDTHDNVLDGEFRVMVVDTIPPSWVVPPSDQVTEMGEPFISLFMATDPAGLHMWWVNDTTHFTIEADGTVVNATILLDGVYICEVWVNDTYGNSQVGVFTLTVHPASPPTWVETPQDQVLEYSQGLVYDLNATDMSGLGQWWLNDTIHFAIDDDGLITNTTALSVGTYGLLVSVNDTLGNVLHDEFAIYVVDATFPEWVEIPEDQTVEYGMCFVCNLNATDMSGLGQWWLNDTIHFAINENGVITNMTSLNVGAYGLQVSVNNTLGNVLSDEFSIHVIDTTPPYWLDFPENQILEYGTVFACNLNATDLSEIDIWWVNDTLLFLIDLDGLVCATDILEPGLYWIRVFVNDTFGNTLWADILIDVRDTTPPEWLIPVTDQYLEYGEVLEYQLSVFDLSNIMHWNLNATLNFHISSSGLITNKTALKPGQYGLLITAQDPYGNELSAELTVFVGEEITATITSITTTTIAAITNTTTTTSGLGDIDPILAYIVGAALAGALIAIIVVVFLKKR